MQGRGVSRRWVGARGFSLGCVDRSPCNESVVRMGLMSRTVRRDAVQDFERSDDVCLRKAEGGWLSQRLNARRKLAVSE